MKRQKSLLHFGIVYAFAPRLYLLICSVKLNLGLIDVQGLSIVANRHISKGAVFP